MLHGLGFLSALSWALLGWLNRPGHPPNLPSYYILITLCWISLGAAIWRLKRSPAPARHGVLPVLLWASVFRVIGFCSEPVMEDDYYRYLWDGRQLALTGNPYQTSPQDHFSDSRLDTHFEDILSHINYPHLRTIYAPVLQYVFGAAYIIKPGELWALKLLLLGADLGVAWLLYRGGGGQALTWYAWCPLLIQETSFTCHPDLIGVLFMLAAWRLRTSSRGWLCPVLLGLSIGCKITGIVITPFLLKGRPAKDWGLTVLTIGLVYFPFWIQGSGADWESLVVFAREWEFNSGGFAVLRWLLSHELAAPAALLATLPPLAWLWFRHLPGQALRGDWIYGWFFLWSAVVQPWYLLWMLPWVALYPTWAGVTALASVSLSYITPLHLGESTADLFGHPAWVRPLEYGAVGVALLAQAWRRRANSNVS